MVADFGFSDLECKIIKAQIERRARNRCEFLKMRTDPCKHSLESGYVFDPAIQKYVSMKVRQFDYFKANSHSILFGIISLLPMFLMGYVAYTDRAKLEMDCRCGILKYRDRMFVYK